MIKSLKKRNKIYVRDPNRLERLICAERQYFHHPQNWTDPHARSRGKQKRGGNRRNEKEGRGEGANGAGESMGKRRAKV